MGLPTWSAQITRSGAVPNDEANDQTVVVRRLRALASPRETTTERNGGHKTPADPIADYALAVNGEFVVQG